MWQVVTESGLDVFSGVYPAYAPQLPGNGAVFGRWR